MWLPEAIVIFLLEVAIVKPEEWIRTDDTVVPTRYQIAVEKMTTDAATESGVVQNTVTIELKFLKFLQPFIELDLNSECRVVSAVLISENKKRPLKFTDTKHDKLQVHVAKLVVGKQSAEIQIQHTCPVKYETFGKGLYFMVDSESKERTVVTQLEAIEARRMFPCFDKPQFKTPFSIKVKKSVLRQGESVFSNSAKKKVREVSEYIEFEDTIALPTYLVALAIGTFTRASSVDSRGTEIGILQSSTYPEEPPEFISAKLNAAMKYMDWMTEFTGIKYPSRKLDIASVPLSHGGMENYGLITIRDVHDFDLDIVAHEVAHMWFGDMVTPLAWDGLWLNEGFACFFETLLTAGVKNCRENALHKDKQSPTKLRYHYNSSDIDPITNHDNELGLLYSKGCAVLSMLEATMGTKHFRNAIQKYLLKYYLGTVTTDRFLAVLDEVADKEKIAAFRELKPSLFMKNWVDKRGYPVVEITYDGRKRQARLQQTPSVKGSNDTWFIPIWYSQPANGKQITRGPFWLFPNNPLHLDISHNSSIIWDPDSVGYYEVVVNGVPKEMLNFNAIPLGKTYSEKNFLKY